MDFQTFLTPPTKLVDGKHLLITYKITVVIHLHEVGAFSLGREVVVLGDPLLVLGKDLQSELLLGAVAVRLSMHGLPLFPLLHEELEEGDGRGRRDQQGQSEEDFHLGTVTREKIRQCSLSYGQRQTETLLVTKTRFYGEIRPDCDLLGVGDR